MYRRALILFVLQISYDNGVQSAKQQVPLSDSFLPVAMQVIAHLTDQMAFETDETSPPSKPVTSSPVDQTTPYHKPGYYAPQPPKPIDRFNNYHQRFLLPLEEHAEYSVIKPQETPHSPFLSIRDEEVQPLIEPSPKSPHLLPPHYEVKIASRSDGFVLDEDLSEEGLQYLSDDVKEMIQMARNPHEERVVDVWEGVRSGPGPVATRAKLSASNLRLLLLYDLLSRDAKRQRLSEFSGFSPAVMKVLVDSSSGGARAQLRLALSKMVERRDCGHEYANNRAKEMVEELAKDESKLSSELRYLQPLVYKY